MRQSPSPSQLFVLLFSLLCLTGCLTNNDAQSDATFLAPYINVLKQETSPKALQEIVALPRSELVHIHFGYGTRIRNKWLWSDKDPRLTAHFKSQGISHPDDMSGKIIEALWDDLNKNLSAAEKAAIEKQREVFLQKQDIFQRISEECTKQLQEKRPAIDRCYAAHSPSLKPLSDRPIFNQLVVSNKGTLDNVTYAKNISRDLSNCLKHQARDFTVSEFEYYSVLTLYPIEMRAYTDAGKKVLLLESCNVKERFD